MKKNILIGVSIGIILLIILVITLFSKDNNTIDNDTTDIVDISISQTGNILSQEENEKIQEDLIKKQEQERLENIKLVNSAGQTGNTAICQEIKDTKTKQDCIDNGNLAKASLENNAKHCLLVKNENSKNDCLNNYYYNDANKKNDEKICEKIKNISLRQICIADITFYKIENSSSTQDLSICKNLSGNDKIYCENKIKNSSDIDIFTKAIETNNINDCQKITLLETKNNCLDTINLQLAINNNDILKCNLIKDTNKKENCKNALSKVSDANFLKEAISKNDIKVCGKIINTTLKEECSDSINFKLAIQNKDESKCSILKTRNLIAQCKDFFQTLKQN